MGRQAGFTLIDAVLALAILACVSGGVFAALAGGRAVAMRGRHEAVAAALAASRLAELRAATFTSPPTADDAGLPDTPADALWRDRDGCVDYLDAAGRPIGDGGARPAAYVRRWRIARRGSAGAELAVLAVLVAPIAEAARAAQAGDPRTLERRPGVVVVRGALARRAS